MGLMQEASAYSYEQRRARALNPCFSEQSGMRSCDLQSWRSKRPLRGMRCRAGSYIYGVFQVSLFGESLLERVCQFAAAPWRRAGVRGEGRDPPSRLIMGGHLDRKLLFGRWWRWRSFLLFRRLPRQRHGQEAGLRPCPCDGRRLRVQWRLLFVALRFEFEGALVGLF